MNKALREGLWILCLFASMMAGIFAIAAPFMNIWLSIYSVIFLGLTPVIDLLLDKVKPSHI